MVSDDELAPEPVTRLIIRDPEQSEADFVQLAERLGLHGVSYFVGWTAWLDIAPEGVDKSTGLKVALAQYGLDAVRSGRDRGRTQRHRDAHVRRARDRDGFGARTR